MQVTKSDDLAIPDDELPLRSVRLSPRFKQAAAQTMSPFELHHTPAPGTAAARPAPTHRAGGSLPRVLCPGGPVPAPDPALHELRVASLDRGLLWSDTLGTPTRAAAHSAPAVLKQTPVAATFEPAGSLHGRMQVQRAPAQPQTVAAVAAAQLACKVAIAMAMAQAGADVTLERTVDAVAAAAFAASMATSAVVSAAFSQAYKLGLDISADVSEHKDGSFAADADLQSAFAPLAHGMGALPTRHSADFAPRVEALFSGRSHPGNRTHSLVTGPSPTGPLTQPLLPFPPLSASSISATMGHQPEPAATSVPSFPHAGDSDGSPAASPTSDKENMSPFKPAAPAAMASTASMRVALIQARLGEHASPVQRVPPALAARPALPPRPARADLQLSTAGWQVGLRCINLQYALAHAGTSN